MHRSFANRLCLAAWALLGIAIACGSDDSASNVHATGGTGATLPSGGSAGKDAAPDCATCGTGGVAGSASGGAGGTAGSAGSGGSAGDAACPPPPAALPSGPLTRFTGNPLLKNGPELYDAAKTGPRVVIKMAANDYRMWYEAVSGDWSNGTGVTAVGYATSSDGTSWSKQGIVMSPDTSSWEKSEVSPNSILIENGVFRLYYHGGGYPSSTGARLGNARIGLATSSDGLSWTKQQNPVLDIGPAGSFDDDQVAEPRVLVVGSQYRMYFTGRNANTGNTALGFATSSDGSVWTKSGQNPILDSSAWGNFWGGAFFAEGGIWHLWHGVASSGSSSLHYMWSTDGISWNDGANNPVLTPSTDSGAADYGLVGDSVSGYRDGATYRILYTGFNSNLFGSEGRFEGICMASVAAVCP